MASRNTRTAVRKTSYVLKPALLAIAIGCAGQAMAVEGGKVVAGTGTITQQGNRTRIDQSSDKMIVNWNNFDIGSTQYVDIRQPSATSAVLNRVTGPGATQIQGGLYGNGRVFVVNRDGVTFGSTARVNVGSLVASALDVSDADFMKDAGRYGAHQFSGYGRVRNDGIITARDSVVLMGTQAENGGTIRAKSVGLHSANHLGLYMDMEREDATMIYLREGEGASTDASVVNSGLIVANGGNIKMAARGRGDLIGSVVRNSGTLEATSAVQGKGGRIELEATHDGSISVGGNIRGEVVEAAAWGRRSMADYDEMPFYGPGHNVVVEKGARVTASKNIDLFADTDLTVNGYLKSGDISLHGDYGVVTTTPIFGDNSIRVATRGDLTANGLIGQSIRLTGDDVTTTAPIYASTDFDVKASGHIQQGADIVATRGYVSLNGDSITQAAGTIRAGDYVKLTADNGRIEAGAIQGRQIDVTASDIVLNGDLVATGNINVTAEFNNRCPADVSCAPREGQDSIVQNRRVSSQQGHVAFHGDNAVMTQGKYASTDAAGKVGVSVAEVTLGKVTAGETITVDANKATLTGRLTAPDINVPANTVNADKYVRPTL